MLPLDSIVLSDLVTGYYSQRMRQQMSRNICSMVGEISNSTPVIQTLNISSGRHIAVFCIQTFSTFANPIEWMIIIKRYCERQKWRD